MIGETTFYGGAVYLSISSGPHQIPLGARVVAVNAVSGLVSVRLPAASSGRMAPAYGLSSGPLAWVVNLGPQDLRVQDASGTVTVLVPPGNTARCVLDETGLVPHDVTISRPLATTVDALVAGGNGTGGPPAEVDTAERLGAGDTWSSAAKMTKTRGNAGGASSGQQLFIAGRDTPGEATGERFRDGAWSALPALASPRAHVLAGWACARLHFIGGTAEADAFDPISQTMASIAAPPMDRTQGTSVSLGAFDRVLLYPGLPALSPPWAYHAKSDTYETLPATTGQDRRSTSGFARDGRAWVCGGYEDATSTALDLVETFDPVTRVWAAGPSLPAARYSGSGFALADRGYWTCGFDAAGSASDVTYKIQGASWAVTTAKPSITTDAANQAGAVR
jgi:hypothetical protein